MDVRATELIGLLRLKPHPEGGFYCERYRSRAQVQPLDARSARAALTTIDFLLPAGEVSRWHRVASDEVWHWLEGDPLELFTIDPSTGQRARHVLGPVARLQHPEYVVEADTWQAARSIGRYTLVGCIVGPGFEFADFELLQDSSEEAVRFDRHHPDIAAFL